VIIQTHQPSHWVIRDVVENNYEAFYERDLYERKKFHYPPHSRLVEITLKHVEEEKIMQASTDLASLLRMKLGSHVFGPHQPIISKIRNQFIRNLMIKIERESSVTKAKEFIRESIREFYSDKPNQRVQVHVDVDPL